MKDVSVPGAPHKSSGGRRFSGEFLAIEVNLSVEVMLSVRVEGV